MDDDDDQTILTFDEIKKFKVAKLKACLSKLGLHVSGLKADLVARLASFYEAKGHAETTLDVQDEVEDKEDNSPVNKEQRPDHINVDSTLVSTSGTLSIPVEVKDEDMEDAEQSKPLEMVPAATPDNSSDVVLPLVSEMLTMVDARRHDQLQSHSDHPVQHVVDATLSEGKPVPRSPPDQFLPEHISAVEPEPCQPPETKPVQQDSEPVQQLSEPAPQVSEPVQHVFEPVQHVFEPVQHVFEPVQQVFEPVQHVFDPVQQVFEPVRQVFEPVRQVFEPVQQLFEPVQQVFEPVQQVFEPVQQVFEPVQQVFEPVQQVFEPVQQVSEPVQQASGPVQQASEPEQVQQASEPVQQASEPVQQASEPVQQVSEPRDRHVFEPVQKIVTAMVSVVDSTSLLDTENVPVIEPLPVPGSDNLPAEATCAITPVPFQPKESDQRDALQDDSDMLIDASQNELPETIAETTEATDETSPPQVIPEEDNTVIFAVEKETEAPENIVPSFVVTSDQQEPKTSKAQQRENFESVVERNSGAPAPIEKPAVELGLRSTSQSITEENDSGYHGEREDDILIAEPQVSKKKKKKKKKRKKRGNQQTNTPSVPPIDDDVEVEYVAENVELDASDPVYAQFAEIFEKFKFTDTTATTKEDEGKDKKETVAPVDAKKADNDNDDDEMDTDTDSDEENAKKQEAESGDKVEKLSKKKLKLKNRMTVAELKQYASRPEVVEIHDVNSPDPKLLVDLKACRNTVPVPRHWCFKRKYLQGKRGIIKPPYQLPDFIQKTGIMEMREALQEKEDAKNMKAKMREKVRPKMGKIDIDYQKLHDAFFKWQTKPKMTIHGDLYYEGKEFETKLKEKKPGDLSEELRTALGMPTGQGSNLVPPPWLIAMQRYGPPPSYPNLKIPGLNAPIPEGASFGYHAGGWGKPPVDEQGRPLYGDVFGVQQTDANLADDEQVDKTFLWGELESESEESEESEEEDEEEPTDQSGLVTPAETGLVTPSGLTSIPAGMETPDMIELRKRKNIEESMESTEQPSLYTVLPEKRTGVGAMMMGSSHVYDLATAVPAGTKKTPGGLSEGVEVALDPSELELDPAAMQARYDEQLREQQSIQKEDFSDMVAEHAARQQKKRKKTTDSGKAAKKYKEFKF